MDVIASSPSSSTSLVSFCTMFGSPTSVGDALRLRSTYYCLERLELLLCNRFLRYSAFATGSSDLQVIGANFYDAFVRT